MAAGKNYCLLMAPEGELLILSAILEVKPKQILAQTALILTFTLFFPSSLLGPQATYHSHVYPCQTKASKGHWFTIGAMQRKVNKSKFH